MMKRSSILPLILLSVAFVGCKTQESIRREREVEMISQELQATKTSTMNSNQRFQTLESQISTLTGYLEEAQHSKQKLQDENTTLVKRIELLESGHKQQVEYLKALTEKVNNQSDYIAEVLTQLKTISAQAESAKKKIAEDKKREKEQEEQKKNTPSTFKNGFAAFQQKDIETAKRIFNDVAANKGAAASNREGSIYYLGLIEYQAKNYKNAQVHFSKIVADNQQSKFAPDALLQLGKTFNQLKQKDDANLSFEMLVQLFPDSKQAKEAQKLIKK